MHRSVRLLMITGKDTWREKSGTHLASYTGLLSALCASLMSLDLSQGLNCVWQSRNFSVKTEASSPSVRSKPANQPLPLKKN